MIKFLTGGESHGQSLTGVIEGIPANLLINKDFINKELGRRQKGYGRSERMKIENDEIEILSGVINGLTTGSPISISIKNRGTNIDLVEVTKPRPGHGDLAGALKYKQVGGRNILERVSARETAMRVAIGGICKIFLNEFNINIYSHVINIGGISSPINYYNNLDINKAIIADNSLLRVIDKKAEDKMMEQIVQARLNGTTLGGTIEIIVQNMPTGIGNHISWDSKLDGLLAQALISIPGIKAVEFGLGVESANISGDKLHDEIYYKEGYQRHTNNAGGIEAGISNGEDLVIRIHMKPIPTLKRPLHTVDMITKGDALALSERSDVCAVPAAGIVGEAMVAYVLANEFSRKFGGDFIQETKCNFNSYKEYLQTRWGVKWKSEEEKGCLVILKY